MLELHRKSTRVGMPNLCTSIPGHDAPNLCFLLFLCSSSLISNFVLTTNMAEENRQNSKLRRLFSDFKNLDDEEKVLFLRSSIKECKHTQLQSIFEEIERILAKDFINVLPAELAEAIFSYVDAKTLCRVSCVNRKWRRISNSDKLWFEQCKKRKWESYFYNEILKSTPGQLITRPSSASKRSSFSPYDFSSKRSSILEQVCQWKDLYIRVFYLEMNWAQGIYSVKPVLRGHTQPVTCMDCNGKMIASGSSDLSVRLWDMNTFDCKFILTNFHGSVKSLQMKGNLLVTGCSDSVIRIFDTETHAMVRELHGHDGSVDHICFDGTFVASASSTDRNIRVWNVNEDHCLYCLEGHTDEIEMLRLWNDYLVSASWDESVRIWCIHTGMCLHSLRGHTEVVMCCQMDNEKLVTGGADGNVIIWDIKNGHLMQTLYGEAEVYCLQFNEKIIASGSADSIVSIWSVHGKLLHVLEGHIGIVRCLSLHGNRLISGGDCKKVIVWDTEKGRLLNIVHRHPTSLHIMWTDETRIVTASPQTPGTITVLSYWS